jgi:hypothetical protein
MLQIYDVNTVPVPILYESQYAKPLAVESR